MLIRRIRGILVTATMFGFATWVLFMISAAIIWLLDDQKHRLVDSLRGELGDSLVSFVFGAVTGALLASLLIIAERRKDVGTVSALRFRLWGAVAGALPMIVVEQVLRMSEPGFSLKVAGITVFFAGLLGSRFAGHMLRLARRRGAKREALSVEGHVG